MRSVHVYIAYSAIFKVYGQPEWTVDEENQVVDLRWMLTEHLWLEARESISFAVMSVQEELIKVLSTVQHLCLIYGPAESDTSMKHPASNEELFDTWIRPLYENMTARDLAIYSTYYV